MPDPIQNIPLGLLSVMPPPFGGMLPAAQAAQRVAPPRDSGQRGQGLLSNLFNTGSQPTGYTPEDVQKIISDRAGYYQNYPIIPMWNGGKGAGGVLPGIGNFAAGFMGSSIQGDQQRRAQENERIRREAANAASQS